MAPTSYQGRREKQPGNEKSHSQEDLSAMLANRASTPVSHILEEKGTVVFMATSDTTVKKAAEELSERNIGVLLVVADDGTIEGIVSERDIVCHLQEARHDGFNVEIGEIMTRDLHSCRPEDTLRDIKPRMVEGRFRHMPVLDNGKLCGLISISDVVKFRLLELEYEALKIKQALVG